MGNIQTSESYSWWQTGIIYEIYLRSFQDSNEDGIGDLRGIIHRLDYLQWLGVNIIWLTPFYPSPMKDFGYDISDYTAVDPQFGTMHDFDELLDDVHARGMKLIIDFVPNHTSDQHPWFKESRSSKNNPKRDWYIWKDKKENGSPPCNWLSVLGGSAWEWDGHTRQLYYHAFLKEQPDLNFSNEEVISAVADLMRFWLDKGVDGFRIDAMWHLAKDPLLRDNPPNPDYNESMPDCDRLQQIYSCDRPEVQGIVSQLRAVIDEYPDRLMIGEIYLSPEKCVAYYGKRNDGAHLPSNFQLLFLPWEANTIAQAISNYERLLPDQCWPNWAIGNHDRPRLMERIPAEQSRVAAMLLLTLRGTPTLYYADEIGMPQVPIPGDEVRDPQGLLMPDKGLSRDPQRTPMQWDQNENAGFTTVTPWLRLSDDHDSRNVATEKSDRDSILNFYQRLISLRQREPSLIWGNYIGEHADAPLLAYRRVAKGHDSFLIVLNLGGMPAIFQSAKGSISGTIVFSTSHQMEDTINSDQIYLDQNTGIIVKLRDDQVEIDNRGLL